MKHFLYLISFLLLTNCFYSQSHYRKKINSFDQFEAMAGDPLNEKFADVSTLKLVYEFSSKNIYYFNSKTYTYHHSFCMGYLEYSSTLEEFNRINYSADLQRDFLLANLNYVSSGDIWFLEIAASDKMDISYIEKLYTLVKDSFYAGDKIKFYLNTPRLMNLAQENKFQIPTIYSDEIFKNISIQPIKTGETIGKLQFYDLKNGADFHPKEDEIIIINQTPLLLPKVKGVIVTQPQTPLSHLVLLAKSRGFPLVTDINAFTNSSYQELEGTVVSLAVKDMSYKLAPSTKKITRDTERKTKWVLPKDSVFKEIVDLQKPITHNYTSIIGSKAYNLGVLKSLETEFSFNTPEMAYAIPFYYYQEHIKSNDIQPLLDALYALPKDADEAILLQLEKIRKKIKNGKINQKLLQSIRAITDTQQAYTSFKFRSSTNAEDIEGFNGAGLYDSKSYKLGDPKKTLEKALTSVWASLWNESAYYERNYYQIDHTSCAMGVLFHRSFPNEEANAVVITENLYRNYKGITVNAQKGEHSVVNPEEGVLCDEFYVHNFNGLSKDFSIDYRSISSLNNTIPIVSEDEIISLFKTSLQLEKKINKIWKKHKASKKYTPIDMEVKWEENNRQLYIKQVRPYID